MKNSNIHIEMKEGYRLVRRTVGDKEIISFEPDRFMFRNPLMKLLLAAIIGLGLLLLHLNYHNDSPGVDTQEPKRIEYVIPT